MNKNQIIIALIGVIFLASLFYLLKPKAQTFLNLNQTSTSATTSPSATIQTNLKTFSLDIKNKKLVAGPETIQVNQGDEVEIKVTSDEDEELHLHGYDKSLDLEASKEANLRFIANLTGHFEYELEHSKATIGALEVLPK